MNNTDTQTVQYTPGPWFMKHEHPAHKGVFSAPDGALAWRIVRFSTPCGEFIVTGENDTDARREANAHLIAAAPELLEELRKAIDFSERNPFCSLAHYIENAPGLRAAIAKAEGRSS